LALLDLRPSCCHDIPGVNVSTPVRISLWESASQDFVVIRLVHTVLLLSVRVQGVVHVRSV
jgi:hypothetical protein